MRNLLKNILFFLSILITSCQSEKKPIDCGKIEYQITYLNISKDDLVTAVLPETMEFSFKNDNTSSKIEGFYGIFAINQVYNKRRESFTTTLKMMGQKYIYEEDAKYAIGNYGKDMKPKKIEFLDQIKEIAGYQCHKALVYFESSDSPVEVFYSNDIKINKPNLYTPYSEIDGVLFQYQINLNNMKMQLNAQNVWGIDIPDDVFEIPYGYLPVSKEEMKNKLEEFTPEESKKTNKPN